MSKGYSSNKSFSQEDYSKNPLPVGDYENCQFENCNFLNSSLAHCHFTDCAFIYCNLSMVKLTKTTFNNIQFSNCKMTGLHFEQLNPVLLSVAFENCVLQLSSFYQSKLKGTLFNQCNMQEVDFTEADCTSAAFIDCDLLGATFDNTRLEKSDLSSALNFIINPETNYISKAKFSISGLPGLLNKYGIQLVD